ncbi:PKD domain-containing protein [Methanothermococcus okinawensis]|uniref:PKD domain containing protein n=1 Tax=Methanothermococcus okinawensis (strain DSM 14208 / JCM 11175 / IH1) TaxID=647113 RepID=F8AJT5_METOI|nr:PKD domain-containing protein [Methanothermococcus okinawensis]AEH07284.1 PKD domain containing protein [Methanothermococcus okinawensis IH1]
MKAYSILLSLIVILGALPLSFASETTENVAVVVSTPADAVVAAPYAKAMGYKLVYTPTDKLSDNAKKELEVNDINKVIIVGGPVAVSNNVESQISKLNINTNRIWGETRVETSQKMYEVIKKEKPELANNIVIAEGFDEKIIPVAVSFGAPVVYYGLNKDDKVADLLKTTKPENAVIIGSKVPKIITNTVSTQAKNTFIASGSEDSVIKTALSFVPKINPNAENKDVAVVYAEKTNNPVMDAIVSFVKGYVGAIAPIPVSKENIIDNIISKLTFAPGISVSSDSTSISSIISNVASNLGVSSTTIKTTPSVSGGRYTPPVDEKPVINKFDISVDGLKATFNINVSDDKELKKIVLKYGDGTKEIKNISGKSNSLTISKNYLMQGKYTATLTVYDDKDQATTSSETVNLKYFDISPEYLSKIVSGNVDESIPITITNYKNKSITITNTSTSLNVNTNTNLVNTSENITCNIKNTSALSTGKSYQAKVIFALKNHPEINKTFVMDVVIPKIEVKTTSSGKSVSLQVVNTTTTTNTSIEINDNATNAFVINTTVGAKSLDIAIPTTNTSNTSGIENTTIHLENVKDALDRAEEIQNTSTLTETLIKPVVVASKDVSDISVDVKNISINGDTNKATVNTEIKFNKSTNDTYAVVAIPVGNNPVDNVYKEGLGAIPQYDGTGTQRNYYKYDAANGVLILFLKDDPIVSFTLSMKAINQPPIIDHPCIENGLNVLINASNSHDPEGKNLTFTWSAPGAQSVSYLDGGKTINITYPADGTYNITLTVSDGVYDVSAVITVSVTQPVAEKPAIKIIANGKTIEFAGQDNNTLSIAGTKTINLPHITANVNVVNKKDTNKGIDIYFKDNASVESVIEAMNNYNTVSYNGDNITITYNNANMNGKNVTLSVISNRKSLRNAINKMLNGNASDLIGLIEMNQYSKYNCVQTVSNNKATWTLPASDFSGDVAVVITEGGYTPWNATYVKILAVGGFEVMKYNMTLTYVGTNPFANGSIYNISINDTPTHNVRYGLAMINKNAGITLNVVGTNPNNNLFNVSVAGNSGTEIVVNNNDLIPINASKINDIVGTIFTPDTASATYSPSTTSSSVTLKLQNISNAYVIGTAYDTVDKKIVAVEQQ